MKNLVIFGAPGSGKGTQSEKLMDKYSLGHISTGDVLRAQISKGTELGSIAKGYMDEGKLIPDELIINILANQYDSLAGNIPGVIFDGFPRTIPQAEALKEMLTQRNHKLSAMIELDVNEEELIKRLLIRGKISGRTDDNEDTIRKRLQVYQKQTAPLIQWYKAEKIYYHINGQKDINSIFEDICQVVDNI